MCRKRFYYAYEHFKRLMLLSIIQCFILIYNWVSLHKWFYHNSQCRIINESIWIEKKKSTNKNKNTVNMCSFNRFRLESISRQWKRIHWKVVWLQCFAFSIRSRDRCCRSAELSPSYSPWLDMCIRILISMHFHFDRQIVFSCKCRLSTGKQKRCQLENK